MGQEAVRGITGGCEENHKGPGFKVSKFHSSAFQGSSCKSAWDSHHAEADGGTRGCIKAGLRARLAFGKHYTCYFAEMFLCFRSPVRAREETQLVVTITPLHLTRCSEIVAQGLVQLTF